MNFIIFILVVVVLTVFPVMIAAKLLGAEKTTFWVCVLAVIASVAAENVSGAIISNPGLSGFIALAITAVCFSVILGAKFFQSLLIALLSIGVQYGLAMLVAGLGIATGTVEVTT